ncbi:hypothetical protein SYN63AY4M2_08475 [Synechococcus sp. 63AY4M2]|nr:hypothetical protein CYA_2607 [Synechococcus sp. JA-3-3Ab]PIK84792.1 hypothetical protein SYN65AY6A5_12140 [Synechococcus sp. 65AY6A5]PIK87458.1 hypothetical protein SYN63AY4M2_08475 [Synechococcus sp. 63AY4M2]PIK96474.1 hypothetical protein SYN60AY4M2_09100 [Synechococcus sp. 60AY4M2]PIK99072.1 hypothetical protein SYN63AY4M1_06490 [Synechococcus sp. 63AY4M1]
MANFGLIVIQLLRLNLKKGEIFITGCHRIARLVPLRASFHLQLPQVGLWADTSPTLNKT